MKNNWPLVDTCLTTIISIVMQIQSSPSSLYSRAVGSSVQGGWRGHDQSTARSTPTNTPPVKDKPAPAAVHDAVQQHPESTNDQAPDTTPPPPASQLLQENRVQQQQSAAVFSPASAAEVRAQAQNKRRVSEAQRQAPLYSLASYTGHRANLTYLDVAGAKQGRVVDELI